MANQKEFKLVINGVEESISKIDALSKQIDNLGARIDEISKKTINIQADISGGNVDTAATAAVTAELEKQKEAAKELAQLHRDISKGIKDEEGNYTNTLAGMRRQLSDMKKELSTMTLGTEEWAEMSSRVNDVNTQVKNLEKSFGVFNRQVGNYEIVADGMSKLKLTIGDVDKEFSSAREASKALKNELTSLGAQMYELEKAGKQGTEEYRQLAQQFEDVASASDRLEHISEYTDRLADSIKDDSGAFGELTRSFESLNAVVNVGVGIMGLFGDTSDDVQKAINRTVQVTTVMKGIQELINTQFQKGAPLMKAYNVVLNSLTASRNTSAVAAKAASVATATETTALVAEAGAATTATLATRAFAAALTATGIGAIVVGIGMLVSYLMDAYDAWKANNDETAKYTSNVEMAKASLDNYYKSEQKILEIKKKLGELSNEESIKLKIELDEENWKEQIEQLEKDYLDFFKWLEEETKSDNALNNFFKTQTKDVDALSFALRYNTQTVEAQKKTYEEQSKNYAKTKTLLNQIEKALSDDTYAQIKFGKISKEQLTMIKTYLNTIILDYENLGNKIENMADVAQEQIDRTNQIANNNISAMADGLSKVIKSINQARQEEIQKAKGDAALIASINAKYDRQIINARKSSSKELQNINNSIQNNRIAAMKDGFNKTIAQLKMQERQEIQQAESSGRNIGAQKAAIQAKYNALIKQATQEHLKEMDKMYKEHLSNLVSSTNSNYFKEIESKLNQVWELADMAYNNAGKVTSPLDAIANQSSVQTLRKNLENARRELYNFAVDTSYSYSRDISLSNDNINDEYTKLYKSLGKTQREFTENFIKQNENMSSDTRKWAEEIKEVYSQLENIPDFDKFNPTSSGVHSDKFMDVMNSINDLWKKMANSDNSDDIFNKLGNEFETFLDTLDSLSKNFNDNQTKNLTKFRAKYLSNIRDAFGAFKNVIQQELQDVQELSDKYGLSFTGDRNPFITNKMIREVKEGYEKISKEIEIEIKKTDEYIQSIYDNLGDVFTVTTKNQQQLIKENQDAIAKAIEHNEKENERYQKELLERNQTIQNAQAEQQANKKANEEAIAAAKKKNELAQQEYEAKKKAREEAIAASKAEVEASNAANAAKQKESQTAIANAKNANELAQQEYEAKKKAREEEIAAGKAKVKAENEANAAKKKATDEAIANAKKENEARQQAYDIALKEKEEQEKKNEALREYIILVNDLIKVNKLAKEEEKRLWESNRQADTVTDHLALKDESTLLESEIGQKLADWEGKAGNVGEDTDLEKLSNQLAQSEKQQRKALQELGIDIQTVDKLLSERIEQAKDNIKEIADVKEPEMVEIPVAYSYDEKSFELPPEVEKPKMVDIPIEYTYDEKSFELPPEVEEPETVEIPVEYKIQDNLDLPDVTKPQLVDVPIEIKFNDKKIIYDEESLKNAIMAIQKVMEGNADENAIQLTYNLLLSQDESAAQAFMAEGGKITDEVEDVLLPILQELYQQSGQILDINQIKNQFQQAKDAADQGAEDMKNAWVNKIQKIMDMVVPLLNQAISVANSAIDTAFNNANLALEEEIDAIEDQLDELSDAYDKAEELEQQHKDKVNDIEDELATARGDRRTALLDQLNAEVAARERAFQNEQKIRKQQEALQKRKEALQKQEDENEKERNKAKRITAIIQATINTALGVTQALGAYPPPASYVLAAVVGALGAAEIATIAAQKYAQGGVIEGKSHAQGGVKVLGGQAEVEGGEYITNKRTTSKNVDLLNYINSKDKAFTLADFQKFFSGNRPNYANIGKMRFANGGQLTAPQVNNMQQKTIYVKDNSVYQVSVVDIIREQDNLKSIQVLAGELD